MKSVVVGLGAMLWLAAPSIAQQVQFTKQHSAGEQVQIDQRMAMENNVSVSMNGQVMQQMQQNMRQTTQATLAVQQVDGANLLQAAAISFSPNSGGEMTMTGMPAQPIPSSLAGKSVTVTRTGDKELNFGGQTDGLDQAAIEEVKELFAQDKSLIPKQALSVGQQWNYSPEDLAQLTPPGSGLTANGSGRLVNVETINGRQVATIEVSLTMSGNQDGMNFTGQLSGGGKIDVRSSRPLDVTITGPINASGNQNGMQIELKGSMTMNVKGSISGSGAPVVAPQPQVQNNAPADFNGAFADAGVQITLQQNGNAWTGSLRRGDSAFPIESATVNGNAINGKFRVGDKSFDFSGTLNGNTLNFKTGNSSYNLQRQVDAVVDEPAANPFN